MASKTRVTFPLNNVDYQAEDMQLWHSTRTNGVFSSEGEFLTTVTTGRGIQVSPGRAWLAYERFRGIIFGTFENIPLTVDLADGVFDRIDRVVIRYDVIANETTIQIKKGTPASNPAPPTLERNNTIAYELGIADIRIPKGAVVLNQGMIIDRRLDPTTCGVMKDGVTTIPTDGLLAQFQGWFNTNTTKWENDFNTWFNSHTTQWQSDFTTWFNTIKGMLDGDIATQLAARILAIEQRLDRFEATKVFMTDGTNVETNIIQNRNLANQAFQRGDEVKTLLVDRLISQGVTGVSTSDSFETLIALINLGKRYITGTANVTGQYINYNGITARTYNLTYIEISLDFKPSLIIASGSGSTDEFMSIYNNIFGTYGGYDIPTVKVARYGNGTQSTSTYNLKADSVAVLPNNVYRIPVSGTAPSSYKFIALGE